MEQFPSNSNHPPTDKKERPTLEKVVTGEVVSRPPSLGKKFKSVFISSDFRGARDYIFVDVILPALKNMIVDSSSKWVERVIYGETGRRRPSEPGRPRVTYNAPQRYNPNRYDPNRGVAIPDQAPHIRQARRDPGEIILSTRAEAETVLERLTDLIDNFDAASLQDLNELVGLPSSYIDNKWGWTNLASSDIQQVREGYLLLLPRVEAL